MLKSRFKVAAMDCPSEEQLIRTALADTPGVEHLDFDFASRALTVWHVGDAEPIKLRLDDLDLGTELVRTEKSETDPVPTNAADQSRVLWLALAINAVMFAVELVAGVLAESTGLLADSLDMLADAAVYGIALWAVGNRAVSQRAAARISGWLQFALAIGVLGEVARRGIASSDPEPSMMLAVAALALAANVCCLLILARHRTGGLHMRASWIFTTNDVIANIGVIVAGVLVGWTSSAIPDLVIGAVIGVIVLRGALRILKLANQSSPAARNSSD